MSLRFDATLKGLFTPDPADFVPLYGLPRLPAVLLNVDLSTLTAATDVAIGFGNPLQEVVDLNFQSGPDPDVAARCLLYNAALHFRYQVPIRTILVLLRPKANTPGIEGKLTYLSGASRVDYIFEVVRMWEQPPEPYLRGGVRLLPLAPLCQTPEDKPLAEALRAVVQEIDRRLAGGIPHTRKPSV